MGIISADVGTNDVSWIVAVAMLTYFKVVLFDNNKKGCSWVSVQKNKEFV